MPGHKRNGRVWGRGVCPDHVVRVLRRRKGQRGKDDRRDPSAWADYWRSMLARGWL